MARYHENKTCAGSANLESPSAAYFRPLKVRSSFRTSARSVCAFRCNERETGRIADRHGKRGFAVPECAGGAQKTGRGSASDKHALMETLRGSGRDVSRVSVTIRDQSARLCRTSSKIRLGTVCRNRWRARRHEDLWRISASAEAHKEIWLCGRRCCCRCHRAVG